MGAAGLPSITTASLSTPSRSRNTALGMTLFSDEARVTQNRCNGLRRCDTNGPVDEVSPMCKLTPTPGDLDCHFRGTAGQQVTLSAQGLVGQVLFGETSYGAVQVLAPGQTAPQITITIQAGRV